MTDWLSVPARNALPFVTRTLSKRFEDSKYTASLPPSTPVQLSAYEALRTPIASFSEKVGRLGIGRVRHLSVSDLWVQQASRRGLVTYHKVAGKDNPADLFTKPLEEETMNKHLRRLGSVATSGRSLAAPDRRSAKEAWEQDK